MNEIKGTPREYLLDAIALERHVEETLNQVLEHVEWYGDESATALNQFLVMVRGHRQALETRLQNLPSAEPASSHKENHADYLALSQLYTSLGKAAFGYAFLHTVAHRFYDGPADGTTADLAEKHLRDYAQAIGRINQVTSDFVVQGQSRSGDECRCQCPACAVGICLCAPHGTITVNKAWRDALPPEAQGNLWLRLPRRGSPADRAGLRARDVILAVDGQQIQTIADLQAAIRKHQPGDSIQLRVKRSSGEPQDIAVVL